MSRSSRAARPALWALGGVALVTLPLVVLGGYRPILAAYHHARLRSDDPAVRLAAIEALTDLGPAGVAVLEAVAFDPGIATRSDQPRTEVRELALDALWKLEPDGPDRVDPARLRRYLFEARGLRRGFVGAAISDRPREDAERKGDPITSTAIWEDVRRAAMIEPYDDVAASLAGGLAARASKQVDPSVLPALRRLALEAPDPWTRAHAIDQGLRLLREPESFATLRAALADPDETVRTVAARTLLEDFDDAIGLPILIAALRPPGKNPADDWRRRAALEALVVLASPLLLEVLADEHDRLAGDAGRASAVLMALTRFSPDTGWNAAPMWGPAIDAIRWRLPAQLDPRAIEPRPLHVPVRGPRVRLR